MKEKGSASPDLEVFRPDALPLTYDLAQIRLPRKPIASREAQLLMRRRTSTAVGLSAASDPFYADGLELHVPSVLPYALEIHASGYGAYYGDDMWACP